MIEEQPSPDTRGHVLRDSLGEIRRGFDALAEYFDRQGLRPETPVVLITGWGHLLDPLRLVADALRLRPTTSPIW